MLLHRETVLDRAEGWRNDWMDTYPCEKPTEVPYPRVPLYTLLERAADRYPDHPACTLYNQPTTYAQLREESRRLARALQELGAAPGVRVGLLLPNIPEYLAALQATWLTGATALQLSPLMVAEEATHWLESTDCRIVVTLDLLAPLVSDSLASGQLEHVVLTTLASRVGTFKGMLYRIERFRRNGFLMLPNDEHQHRFDLLVDTDPLDLAVEVDPEEDVAVLAPTGGTTSSPKAVMLTHRNLMSNAMQLRHYWGGEDAQESVLAVLPLFHSYGLTVSVLASWARASTIHMHPRFEPRAVLNLMLEQKPEMIPAVPAMLHALNVLMRRRETDLSFIKSVISGASALSPEVRVEFENHGEGMALVEGYGLTEASPVTHANPKDDIRPGSIGKPLADTEAKLVDPDTGKEVGVGEVGELVIRGPQVMKGYYNNPEATAEALRDGWLYTGDMATRDRDGFYTIVDRKRDIVKTSGFLVFPAEVEEVLRSCEGVEEVAVIGVPDLEKGEVLKAMIVPTKKDPATVETLKAYCTAHLGKQKRPREIEIVSELPKNFLGKVLRRKLREQVVAT